MFILIYGADGSGKSVQCKNIAEANESSEHWSFATKNRRLYADSGVVSSELLRFNEDSTVNPYRTIDAFHDKVDATVKENNTKLVVIDEITMLRKWAQPVVLEEINKVRRSLNKYPLTKIGRDNAAAWGRVNDLVYGQLEHLANWSEINDAIVLAITAITEERRMVVNSDGEAVSEVTGNWIADAKNNVRKLADVIVRLEQNGKSGKGYYVVFEKQQEWMVEGKDAVRVDKSGLLTEFALRGVL
jgi:KaiC/GvpD/RAD55 family RecA-like ATPase